MNYSEFGCAEKVFRYFEEISSIPHGSGNTDKIAEYLTKFAEDRGLFVYRDKTNNVVIRKAATDGREDRPTVIIQGHTDMVIATNDQCRIDPEKDGLELYRDGDFLKARGTTLGGDDGVAVAYALAILDSEDIPHPEIEAVFTSDEETGLFGAIGLDKSILRGRLMLNIDSDVEGTFIAGCAGGMRTDISVKTDATACDGAFYKLTVSGLAGGHSGVEINSGRLNANKLLFKVLSPLKEIRIAEAGGGNADNAIPRSCECRFSTTSDRNEILAAMKAVADESRKIEKNISIDLCDATGDAAFSAKDSKSFVDMICDLPTGVINMCEDIPELVETSLNLGIISIEENEMRATFSIRSAKGEEKTKLYERVFSIATSHGASVSKHGEYPGWEYKKESKLREVVKSTYKEMYGKDAEVVIIHAGLECGIFSDEMPGLDCVSFGPNNYDIHTTEERLSLSSTQRVFEFIKALLQNI